MMFILRISAFSTEIRENHVTLIVINLQLSTQKSVLIIINRKKLTEIKFKTLKIEKLICNSLY